MQSVRNLSNQSLDQWMCTSLYTVICIAKNAPTMDQSPLVSVMTSTERPACTRNGMTHSLFSHSVL